MSSDGGQERTLQKLLGAGRTLVAHLDLEAILRELLELAADITGARYAAIGVLDEDRRELERFLTHGIDESARSVIGDLPRGRGILGVLIEDPRPLRLAAVGGHPHSYGFPTGHPPMSTFLGVPILIRDRAWGNLYLTEKSGGHEFSTEDEEAIVALAGWAGVAIENARLYQTAEGRRTELEQAVRGLESALEIARALGSETTLDRVLELVVKRGRALVGARAIALLLSENGELRAVATAGEIAAVQDGVEAVSGLPLTELDSAAGLAGALVVPLRYRGQPLGALVAFARGEDERGFGVEETALLSAFASSAATAVASARTVAHERLRDSLRAAEAERRRWARELHDETLQGLGATRLLIKGALAQSDAAALRETAQQAADQLATEIDGLRALITELRPAALDDLGLEPALESLTTRLSAVEDLAVTLDVSLGEDRLDPDLETAVYRLVQESLSNIAKHANASQVSVTVRRDGANVRVHISDDGEGFDPTAMTTGFGLVGMRERAALAGGDLTIDASAGAGTTVTAVLPVVD